MLQLVCRAAGALRRAAEAVCRAFGVLHRAVGPFCRAAGAVCRAFGVLRRVKSIIMCKFSQVISTGKTAYSSLTS
ncbi:hypothetical protein KQ486_12150, partial [Allobacillus halotolerans]